MSFWNMRTLTARRAWAALVAALLAAAALIALRSPEAPEVVERPTSRIDARDLQQSLPTPVGETLLGTTTAGPPSQPPE